MNWARRSKDSTLPKYFFHVYHNEPEIDYEGEELPDKHAAWREATVIAGQTLQGLDGKLQPGREWRMRLRTNSPILFMCCTSMQRSPSKAPQLVTLKRWSLVGRIRDLQPGDAVPMPLST